MMVQCSMLIFMHAYIQMVTFMLTKGMCTCHPSSCSDRRRCGPTPTVGDASHAATRPSLAAGGGHPQSCVTAVQPQSSSNSIGVARAGAIA